MGTWQSLEKRFFKKTKRIKHGLVWIGSLDKEGYGLIRVGNKHRQAHRISWILQKGEIPKNKPLILHHCDIRRCVDITHLFCGTIQDDVADMVEKKRQQKGETNGLHKLTWTGVRKIRRLYESGYESHATLAARFGVCRGTVQAVLERRTWRE